ncbi:MAG: heavy-metal-associated domain-containing protein [Proteobacteria bacterium]|nr:heavy-metal-associated domain-containing protein [Pseudomonadota bacterium]
MKKLIIGAASTLFLAVPALAGDIQYDLKLDGITCPFCVATSERALRKIDGVKQVSGDLETGIIRVCADESVKFTDAQLTKVFLKKGFTYKGMEIHENCDGFDSTTVLSTEEMERRAAMHDTMGHGGEEMDFTAFVPADHDHDGDGIPDHGPEFDDHES